MRENISNEQQASRIQHRESRIPFELQPYNHEIGMGHPACPAFTLLFKLVRGAGQYEIRYTQYAIRDTKCEIRICPLWPLWQSYKTSPRSGSTNEIQVTRYEIRICSGLSLLCPQNLHHLHQRNKSLRC